MMQKTLSELDRRRRLFYACNASILFLGTALGHGKMGRHHLYEHLCSAMNDWSDNEVNEICDRLSFDFGTF